MATEAEWEYAAAGGGENRLYPWGSEPATVDHAVMDCLGDGMPGCAMDDRSDILPVGSKPLGNGRWGHSDLGGLMLEWTRDWYAEDWYTTTSLGCSDCANLTPSSYFTERGGMWGNPASSMRAADRRYASAPAGTNNTARCVRTP